MKNKQLSLLLVPVISALLFVSIVTAAPATINSDINTKEIETANAVPQVLTKNVDKPLNVANEPLNVPGTNIAVVEPSTPSPNNVPSSKSTPSQNTNSRAKSTPVKKVQTQPSRSTSALTPPNSSSKQAKANAIIATGKQFIGVKYLYGGTTPSGFDCSGFVQYTFAKNGISLPRVSRDQFKVGTSVSFNNLLPGDLVFFSLAKNGIADHEGIYVGNGQFINASSSKGVTIYTLGPYWQSSFVGAKRVI
jgi:cell wall-associated NlpC family hydrolase